MARKQIFLSADFSDQFREAYAKLQRDQQNGVDRAVMALLKMAPTPGMQIKPIQPDKYYNEARINDGDRLIHRTDAGAVYFVDVVKHDDIGQYGKAPKQSARTRGP